jgi:hypothetical protein
VSPHPHGVNSRRHDYADNELLDRVNDEKQREKYAANQFFSSLLESYAVNRNPLVRALNVLVGLLVLYIGFSIGFGR